MYFTEKQCTPKYTALYFYSCWPVSLRSSLCDFGVDSDAVHFFDLSFEGLGHQPVLLDGAEPAELAGLHWHVVHGPASSRDVFDLNGHGFGKLVPQDALQQRLACQCAARSCAALQDGWPQVVIPQLCSAQACLDSSQHLDAPICFLVWLRKEPDLFLISCLYGASSISDNCTDNPKVERKHYSKYRIWTQKKNRHGIFSNRHPWPNLT